MMVPAELAVLLDQRVIGTLAPTAQTHLHRFRYADDWVRDPGAYPVSLALPLTAGEFEGLAVRNWLRGLLPDNEARPAEIEAEFAVSRDNPYAVLACIGEDCVGAVQFAAAERAAEIAGGAGAGSVEWLSDARLETLLAEIASRAAPDRRAVRTGQFSLPGALGKVALAWDPEHRRWGRPSGQWPSTHILKPPLPGVAFHNENEHFCLALASAAGLSAARSRVVRYGSQSAVAVERYDRGRRPDGTLVRLHQEDMAQALGLDPGVRYAAEGGAGVKEIVQLLRDYARPRDVDEFVRYLAFAWIIANTDAHLRNYSLLVAPDQNVALAPLYDVSSALGLPGARGYKPLLRLAMAIGGMTDLADVDRTAWEREVKRSRLPRRTLSEVAAFAGRVAEVAADEAERLADEEGLDGRYLRRLAGQIQARADGCAQTLA